MSSLTVMLLLGFLLVVALSLTLWVGLGLAVVRAEPDPRAPAPSHAPDGDAERLRPSNDEVRGARAPSAPRHDTEDAFERFLRADGDKPRS